MKGSLLVSGHDRPDVWASGHEGLLLIFGVEQALQVSEHNKRRGVMGIKEECGIQEILQVCAPHIF